MLPRNELLKLPFPHLPKERHDAIYRVQAVRFIARSAVELNGQLLVVALYDREAAAGGYTLPAAIHYQTRDDYITWIHAGGDTAFWRKTMLHKAVHINYYDEVICLAVNDEKRIGKFCEDEIDFRCDSDLPPAVRMICGQQAHILEVRNIAKKTRLAAEIDAEMKLIPPLPAGFHNWIDRGPLKKSRYIFFESIRRGIYESRCSHCKQMMWQAGKLPKHKEFGRCPSCNSLVQYRATRHHNTLHDKAHACILQRIPQTGEYVLRYFRVERDLTGSKRNDPQTDLQEQARLFFGSNGLVTRQFKNGWSSQTDRFGWFRTKDSIVGDNPRWMISVYMMRKEINIWFEPAYLYPHNIHNILRENNLSYEMKDKLYGKAQNVTTYLLQCFRYPFATSLHKIGLSRLSNEILERGRQLLCVNRKGPLHRRLGISKISLKMAIHLDLGVDAVEMLTLFSKSPIELEDMAWLAEHELDKMTVARLSKYASAGRIRRYITKTAISGDLHPRSNMEHHVATIWLDYLQMAQALEHDVTKKDVLMPGRLQHEHDKMVQLTQIEYDPEMDELIQKVYPGLRARYEYAQGDYLIRVPRNFDDFVKEGTELLHCVCTNKYYKDHAKKFSLIFFIRHKNNPDTPYYTLEYNPGTHSIRQLYGYRHHPAKPDVEAFTQDWLDWIAGDKAMQAAA